MKILIINFEYPPLGGGGGVATQQWAQALAMRHTIDIITTHMHGLPRREVQGKLTIHRVPVLGRQRQQTASLLSLLSFAPAALIAGLRLTARCRYDVLNAQFVLPSGLPAA